MNLFRLSLPLTILLAILLITSISLFAQTPTTGIFFQAIARDQYSNPAKDRKIYVQSSILQSTASGDKVLTEIHQTTTDGSGIFSISVGQGSNIGGTVANLNQVAWDKGPYYLGLKIAIVPILPDQNWDYTKEWIDLGTSPFGTVPYALYAGSTSGLQNKLNTTDTTNMLRNYVTTQMIRLLDSAIDSKLSVKDTINMLASYVKASSIQTSSAPSTMPSSNTFSGAYNDLTGKPILFNGDYNLLSNQPALFSGSYLDLSNQPTLFSGAYTNLTGKPTLFSGAYNDLVGKPTLFSGAYNDLSGKPTLFSGSYLDLSNLPSLFDGDYNALGNRPVLFNGDYNALSNKPTLSLTGDITSVGSATTLSISGVASGTYGSALAIPTITVDEKGRITAASSTSITPNNFPNKTNTEKNALPASTATGTVIWCSDCGTRGQLQVYNGMEWTDLTGGTAASSGIVFTALNLSAISSTSASAAASISSDGGTSITAKGVVWSTSVNPTIALTTRTNDGTGTSAFTSSLTALSTSTLYYIRAYATNANGTVYGAQQSFTTLGAVPTLSTTNATGISLTGGTTGGNITYNGGTTITRRGVCWSTSSNPTINDNKLVFGSGDGSFTVNLTGLMGGTTYYIRAYATNGVGTGYGSQITLTTSAMLPGVAYLGGKIAYIFQAGDAGYVAGQTHGFIIMSHPMGMQVPFTPTSSNTFNTSTDFGTGMNNTQILNGATGNGATAAKSMYGVLYDGYNDWFIPSFAEWNKIALNWTSLRIADDIYHSSSQQSSMFFYTIQFYNNGASYQSRGDGKSSLYSVIGIRKF